MSRSPSNSIHAAITNQIHARFYEGGKRTAANRDFWNANSEFENTATPDRDTMRARARWLHENNPIMANIDDTIVNNVVGKGIRLQSKIGKKGIDDEIEARFKAWAKNCDIHQMVNFYDMQRIILENRMVDGEIYIYKMTTPDGLKLQLIEADALDKSKGENGISYDGNGAPKTYHFGQGKDARDIDAVDIINYFRKTRATQKRGISEYKQSIIDIKNFSAGQTAAIQAARARANISHIIETERSPDDFGRKRDTSDPINGDLTDINGLLVYYLRDGETVSTMDVKGETWSSNFTHDVVRLIGTGRKVSYELAFRDYSKVNFSSSRASLIQDNKRFDDEQRHITEYVLDNVFEAWLELEIMLGKIKRINRTSFMRDPIKYLRQKWSYPRREWVDPIKDLTAAQMEIDMGGSTNTDFCASRGTDYEENLRTKLNELTMKKEILGDFFDLVMAMEQKNKDLLIATLQGGEEDGKNQD